MRKLNQKIFATYGALFHDIGKVLQRYYSIKEKKYVKHQVWGKDLLEEVGLEAFSEFAEKHHLNYQPDEIENPLIFATILGDHLSAAERESEEEETVNKKEFKLMSPLLNPFYNIQYERYGSKNTKEETSFKAQILQDKLLLPEKDEELTESSQLDGYKEIIDNLKRELKNFSRFDIDRENVDYLLNLLEKYTSFIPSETMIKDNHKNDISLFSHLKASAMITSCIVDFLEFKNPDLLNNCKNFRDMKNYIFSEKPFLLVSGDISGVQKYIYTIASKGALRSLRARSFSLELLQESLVEDILEGTGFSRANVMFVGGGHYYLILSNTQKVKMKIEDIQRKTNEFFMKKGMDIRLYQKSQAFECEVLAENRYPEVSKKVTEKIFEEKMHPCLDNLKQEFQIDPTKNGKCSICGCLTDEIVDYEDSKSCINCKKLADAGRKLTNSRYIFEVENESDEFDFEVVNKKYALLDKIEHNSLKRKFCLKRSDIEPGITLIPFSKYTYKKLQSISELAKEGKGADYSATSRMDVDFLGTIFSEGIEDPSISRISTISRFLTIFFREYLDDILEDKKVVVVYAGGDDVFYFLTGAWNDIIESSVKIRNSFNDFTGRSPYITISGGIILSKPKDPVYRVSRLAEKAESMAKSSVVPYEKDALCIFYHDGKPDLVKERTTLKWDEFTGIVEEIKNLLSKASGSSIQKLFSVEEITRDNNKMPLYRPILAYLGAKNEKDMKSISESLLNNGNYIKHLWIALQWNSLLNRKGKE